MRRPALAAPAAVVLGAALALLGGCANGRAQSVAERGAALGTFGVDLSAMDAATRPGDDFYRYVNGAWLDTYEIPADRSRYGIFDALREKAEADVHAILLELVQSDPAPGTTERKIADLFATWMDADAIEARGLEPLRPQLDAIAAARKKPDLWPLFARQELTAPFSIGFGVDPDDATRYAVRISQSGLGMPNREYYLRPGERSDAYRAAYRTYVERVFELIGDGDPTASAERVIGLERLLAKVQWAPQRQRIVSESVNPMDRGELKRLAPEIDWDAVLDAKGLGHVQRVVVRETTAIRDAATLIARRPMTTWKKYLTFHVVNRHAESLPAAFDDAHFAFHQQALRGVKEQRARWKRGVELIDRSIGEGVGPIYVERHFPPSHKAMMDELVVNLRRALAERLTTLEWMDDATREAARRKLASFEPRVGYPSTWRDYSALTIEPGRLCESVMAARRFDWERRRARLDQPVERDEWGMNPQTVNAYYSSSMNQITFPAAILQPPFFDPLADPAVNYGGIGAVIGHEIGHGFDDQGRQYDEAGRLRNWWSEDTNARFVQATDRMAAQFEARCPLPGACINGRLTMGENIGDLGGLEMAHTAYRLSLGRDDSAVIDGFTGDQRFFMSWAQVWRGKYRDDALRARLLTDPHSPPAARGSVPLQNIDAWYTAFDVQPGDEMYLPPETRVRIW